MSDRSLSQLFSNLHGAIEQELLIARKSFAHSGTKGDATESVWIKLLRDYLPKRYAIDKAHVVDSDGKFSEQIDIAIFDRQYSPFVFQFQSQLVVPAESICATFEAKQVVNAKYIDYARRKVGSVRSLKRTSLPIPHAGGTHEPKQLPPILGGVVALDSEWTPPLGEALRKSLESGNLDDRLDIGCIAAHGVFHTTDGGEYEVTTRKGAATTFLLELIARLQTMGTVPMVDVRAYSRWLEV